MALHPNLTLNNHEVTSDQDKRYNCASWAVSDDFKAKALDPSRAPGTIWPVGIPRSITLKSYVAAYATFGYLPCGNGKPEMGHVKIALFEDEDGDFAHAARLLNDGNWSSKLGIREDISHSTWQAIEGGKYGKRVMFMRRPERPHEKTKKPQARH